MKSQQREKQKEMTELEHSISVQKTIFLQSAQTLKSLIEDREFTPLYYFTCIQDNEIIEQEPFNSQNDFQNMPY